MKINFAEYVSRDILEENFVKVFWSFLRIQKMVGSCRVDIRDRFVTAPTIYQRLYTIIWSAITMTISVMSFFGYVNEFYTGTKIVDLCIGAEVVNAITYFSNIIQTRFMNTDSNVKFYIKMQKIDRIMRIENNESINAILRNINNGTVAAFLVIFIVLFLFVLTRGPLMIFGFLGITASYGVFVIEMSYCCNLILYFIIRTRFINSIIANHMKLPNEDKAGTILAKCFPRSFPTKARMRNLAAQSHDFTTSEIDVYLKEIFECFSIFQEVYKFQILLFFINYATFITFSFEFGILSVQSNIITYQEWLLVVTLVVITIAEAVFICIQCETFYNEFKETKRLSVAILSQYFDGPLWEKAKNMLHLIEKTPPYFCVYDMWRLDAHIMINVFGIVTALCFTQLQFAFL